MKGLILLTCKTCGVHHYIPDGLNQEEMQSWYNVRKELKALRENWPGFKDRPRIDHDDYEGSFTEFLCRDHVDHDLCITNAYDHKETIEFKLPEGQETKATPLRCFRELIDSKGFKSDILEIDKAPRLYHSIVKNQKPLRWDQSEMLGTSATPPFEKVRFIYQKEELVLLRTYLEE